MFVVQYQLRSCRGAALEIRNQMKDNEFCAASRLFPWRFFPPIGVWDRTVGPSWEVMTRLVIIDGHRWTEMGAGPSLARSCEASHSPLEADLHLSASPHMVSKCFKMMWPPSVKEEVYTATGKPPSMVTNGGSFLERPRTKQGTSHSHVWSSVGSGQIETPSSGHMATGPCADLPGGSSRGDILTLIVRYLNPNPGLI